MKLELVTFPVNEVRFTDQTSYRDGVLGVDKGRLVNLLLQDNKIDSADVDVAFPGEQTRIVHIRDIVEPRVKVDGPGCVFPGILGPIETVGIGRTHRLSGVTVVTSALYQTSMTHGATANNMSILDMWGPGAKITPHGSKISLVLKLILSNGLSEWEAHTTIQLAEFKVAHFLAETTKDLTSGVSEVFELVEADSTLPGIVYISTAFAWASSAHSKVAFYGWPIRESLPTLVHPNEFLDGAITKDARQGSGVHPTTWSWMNPEIIYTLLREHGKRLNFLGVIFQRTFFETEAEKQMSAEATSQMARLLNADGAIITETAPSGANFTDVMLTVQACEKKEVNTVLMCPEWGGKEGIEIPLLVYVPEANAMVSTGSSEREIVLPAPSKVIGVRDDHLPQLYSEEEIDPWTSLSLGRLDIVDGADFFGNMNLTCKEY